MSALVKEHHKRHDLCTTRKAYRKGRKLTAVKVYTVNSESKYILVQGIPSVGVRKELLERISNVGELAEISVLDDYPSEAFTETVLLKFKTIRDARYVKRKFDDLNFYGGILHICYAPEHETVDDCREKLLQRRKDVAARNNFLERKRQERSALLKHEHKNFDLDIAETVSTPEPVNISTKPVSASAVGPTEIGHNFQHVSCQPVSDLHVGLLGPTSHNDAQAKTDRSASPTCGGPTSTSETTELAQHVLAPATLSHLPPHLDKLPLSDYEQFSGSSLKSTRAATPIVSHTVSVTGVEEKPNKKASEGGFFNKDGLMVRPHYVPVKTASAKFIPRQIAASKRMSSSVLDSSTPPKKSLKESNDELRRNAFVLRKVQGPEDDPEFVTKAPREQERKSEQSFQLTRKKIRQKIREFSS